MKKFIAVIALIGLALLGAYLTILNFLAFMYHEFPYDTATMAILLSYHTRHRFL